MPGDGFPQCRSCRCWSSVTTCCCSSSHCIAVSTGRRGGTAASTAALGCWLCSCMHHAVLCRMHSQSGQPSVPRYIVSTLSLLTSKIRLAGLQGTTLQSKERMACLCSVHMCAQSWAPIPGPAAGVATCLCHMPLPGAAVCMTVCSSQRCRGAEPAVDRICTCSAQHLFDEPIQLGTS